MATPMQSCRFPTRIRWPSPASMPLSYITELSSHELVEGITDPMAYYVTPTVAIGTGWFYQNTAAEIGDPLNGVWFTIPERSGLHRRPIYRAGLLVEFHPALDLSA